MTKLSSVLAAIAASLFLAVLANPAEAMSKMQTQAKMKVDQSVEFSARRHRHSYRHHSWRRHRVVDANGNRSRRTHYARRGGGKCDGFQRCRCGTTAARKHGLPYDYNGWNLKMASEWRRFPSTTFHVGAVGVKPHHVLTIVGGSSCASATVYDDAGTYQRNVCSMSFHSVSGGGMQPTNYSTRRHHRRHYARL